MHGPGDDRTRLRLDLSYDGTEFSGWATQPGQRTVQETVEDAIARVLRLDSVSLTVAGRTDAGVHARGQVAHVDVPDAVLDETPPDLLCRRLARLLPEDVRVRDVRSAPAGFDARFSALWRRYEYRVVDSPMDADPLERRFTLPWPRRLDESSMDDAAQALVGEHDFAAYCRKREGATTIRTLRELRVTRADARISTRLVADAFCHSMVRSLMGALVAVGEGRRGPDWPAAVLVGAVRDPGVTVLPARGLTFEEVGYPPDDALAERAAEARAVRTLS